MSDTLPPEILSLIRRVAAGKKSDDMLLELEDAIGKHKALDHLSTSVHRFFGFQLRLGLRLYLDKEVEALSHIKALDLICAPVVVELIEIQAGEGVLITRWPNCRTGKLSPPNTASTPAKIAFAQDMKTLASAGFIHSWAGRGLQSYFVASDTGAILLDDWGAALQRPMGSERNDTLSDIDHQLSKLR